MLNPSIESPGEWFSCLNVGDDYEDESDRRKEKDLVIPGFSLVEIVGIRKINDDHFVHGVRLPQKRTTAGQTVDEEFIGSDYNFAFTGPGDILKNHKGRIKFAPAMCRFEGETYADANAKIFGRYKAPERQSGGRYTPAEYDYFELQEKLFGDGELHQLLADPKGHLKLPKDITNSDQYYQTGWNALGLYKYHTGEKTKGKKDDEDPTKNILAYVAPAAPQNPGSILFLTKEKLFQQSYQAGTVAVDFLEYVSPRSANWNQKYLVDFEGSFGYQYEWVMLDSWNNQVGPFLISSSADEIKAGFELFPWCGKGNVTVHSPGPLTGRFIIELVGDLAGIEGPVLRRRRTIYLTDAQTGPPLSRGDYTAPPIVDFEIPSYDFRVLPGSNLITITPASRVKPDIYHSWYGDAAYGVGAVDFWYDGPYSYYGGFWGGPFNYWGGGAYPYPYAYGYGYGYGGYGYGPYGPYGYNYEYFSGPYEFDADGSPSPSGPYNNLGYDQYGYDSDGYDVYGYDVNGLDVDGNTWGYYGNWGHFHTGLSSHESEHRNDFGINYNSNDIFTSAGAFGVASWVRGSGYVVVEIEPRNLVIDTSGSGVTPRQSNLVVY